MSCSFPPDCHRHYLLSSHDALIHSRQGRSFVAEKNMEKAKVKEHNEGDLLHSLLIRVDFVTMKRPRVWLEFLLTLPKYSSGGELELSFSLRVQSFILPSISVFSEGNLFVNLQCLSFGANYCQTWCCLVITEQVEDTRSDLSPYIRDSGFTNIVASGVRTDLLCNTQWRRHRRQRQSQFGQF